MNAMKLLFALLFLASAFPNVSAAAPADTATFTLHKAMDTGDTPHLAVSYLIPKGWKTTDTVHWDIAQRSAPLTLSFVTTSPDGRFIVRWLNTRAFHYAQLGNQGDQRQAPPEHPDDLLISVFKNAHPGVAVQVVERRETPTASIFKETPQMKPRAYLCSVKLRYTQDGVPMLTKSGFHYDGYTVPQFSSGLWTLSNITSITGPEAQFPKAMRLGAVVLSSRQWDPQFFQQYREIVLMLLQQAQKEGQEYLDAQFAALRQHFHDLSASNRAAFDAQMAAKDKNTRDFCDYTLDRERYTDGHTQFILPSGYNRAATDGTDYLLTNSPTYSPSGQWHELSKVK